MAGSEFEEELTVSSIHQTQQRMNKHLPQFSLVNGEAAYMQVLKTEKS